MALTKITATNVGYTPANKAGEVFTGNVAIGTNSSSFNSMLDVTGTQMNANGVGGYATVSLRYNGAPTANSYGPGLTFSQYWYNASTSSITTGAISGVKTTGDGNFGGGLAFFSGAVGSSALTERMRIADNGAITKPYQPAFSITGINGATFNSGAVTGGTVSIDNYSGYSTSTGRYTVQVAGKYIIFCSILVSTGTGRLEGNIAVNGVGTISFNGTGTTYDGPVGVMVVQLNVGDYVTVQRTSGTAYASGHGQNYFMGYMLG